MSKYSKRSKRSTKNKHHSKKNKVSKRRINKMRGGGECDTLKQKLEEVKVNTPPGENFPIIVRQAEQELELCMAENTDRSQLNIEQTNEIMKSIETLYKTNIITKEEYDVIMGKITETTQHLNDQTFPKY